MNFNPRSPHGERLLAAYGFRMAGVFQSTLPARGATDADVLFLCNVEFQSTLPARGATRHRRLPQRVLDISIHAPRTGSDLLRRRPMVIHPISIHAPRTGSDAQLRVLHAPVGDFNPRSPHGERPVRVGGNSQTCYFNPRSPHGERLGVTTTQEMLESISIHAPRTGSDRAAGTKRGTSRQFQSTLPARGAT